MSVATQYTDKGLSSKRHHNKRRPDFVQRAEEEREIAPPSFARGRDAALTQFMRLPRNDLTQEELDAHEKAHDEFNPMSYLTAVGRAFIGPDAGPLEAMEAVT